MVVKINTIKIYLTLHLAYFKLALKTAMEYKANFIIQVISMFLNDVVWIFFWGIFLTKFNNINGWALSDMVLLYSMITIAFGVAGLFFGGHKRISKLIVEGQLDYFLTLPKNSLFHAIISKGSWFDLGDILFGVVLAIVFVPLVKLPLLLILLIPAIIILISFGIIAESLSFYIGNSQSLSSTLYEAIVTFGAYPLSIHHGVTKFIVMFIIPAGMMVGVPVILINQYFNWLWFLLIYAFSIGIFLIAIYVFYKGLKKYESGNLIGVRL